MRRLVKILGVLIVLVALILGAATGFIVYTTRRVLPQISGTLALSGLDGTVTVFRDASGVPHIYATTTRDLFFAQGVIQAQDRWWQMEFNRHTGLGRISELTGKNTSALNNDIFIRTVGWNRAAQADLKVVSQDTKDALEAYSSGVNAYIEGKSGADLAVEYSVLGIRGINIPIEKWEPLHSLAWAKVMSWSLGDNLGFELSAAELLKKLGKDGESMIFDYYAAPYPAKHPTIITAEDLPVKPESAQNFKALPDVPVVAPGTDLSHMQTHLIGTPPDLGKEAGLGSNNWVVSGKLTESGKPLVANDPHLGQQMPSIWYQNGLHCVEVNDKCPYDVVGYSFPGVPGVIIGHNGRIAWAVTNGTIDTQDLYIIKADTANDTRYEVDGKMLDMEVIKETIRFGDSTPPQEVRVRLTRFGPIITDSTFYKEREESLGNPLALHWAAVAEPGDLLGAVLEIDRASNWQTFRTGLTKWAWPAQNFVYADVEGNIGYQFPGLFPIRAAGHSGLTPVDGSTTKYDWKGFIPFDYLPRTYNPSRGYIVTANHAIVPPEYYQQLAEALGPQFGADSNYRLSYNWDYGYRGARIVDLIKAKERHSVDSIQAIQTDNYNGSAAEILPALLNLDFGSDIPRDVLDWMGQWDFQENIESGQAALYNAFWVQLMKRLWADQTGSVPGGSAVSWGTALLLEKPDNPWWDDASTTNVKETRDDILRVSFIEGYKGVVAKLGADFKTWTWGALHTVKFVSNPLGASGIGLIESFVNSGPTAANGGAETVNRAAWNPSDPYNVRAISSMRLIMDVGNFGNSRWVNATGQSGHPASQYYRDQIERWRLLQYDSLRWDRAEIEKSAVSTLILQPKGKS